MYREFHNPAETFALRGAAEPADAARAARLDLSWQELPLQLRTRLRAALAAEDAPAVLARMQLASPERLHLFARIARSRWTPAALLVVLGVMLLSPWPTYQNILFACASVAAAAALALWWLPRFTRSDLARSFAGAHVFPTDLVHVGNQGISVYPLAWLRTGRATQAPANWQLELKFGDGRAQAYAFKNAETAQACLHAVAKAHQAVAAAEATSGLFGDPNFDAFYESRASMFQPLELLVPRARKSGFEFRHALALAFGAVLGIGGWYVRNAYADAQLFARVVPSYGHTHPGPVGTQSLDDWLAGARRVQSVQHAEYSVYFASTTLCSKCRAATAWLSDLDTEIARTHLEAGAYREQVISSHLLSEPLSKLTALEADRLQAIVARGRAGYSENLGKGELASGFVEQHIAKALKTADRKLRVYFTVQRTAKTDNAPPDYRRRHVELTAVAERWIGLLGANFARYFPIQVIEVEATKDSARADVVISWRSEPASGGSRRNAFEVRLRQSGVESSVFAVAPSIQLTHAASSEPVKAFGRQIFPAAEFPAHLRDFELDDYAALGELYRAVHTYFFAHAAIVPTYERPF